MIFIVGAIAFLLIIQNLLLLFLINYRFQSFPIASGDTCPKISILIPARNEAHQVSQCLSSLEKLDYPLTHLDIILGDDQSSDETLRILHTWADGKNYVKVISISPNLSGQIVNGKANALAQMAEYAIGDYLLFTDADCEVPEGWAKAMVGAAEQSGAGFVTGVTIVKDDNLFSAFQNLDWMLTLGMVKVVTDLGHAITSMGNNMLISKVAYDQLGGFYKVPFSLTEDFEIAKSLNAMGHQGVHCVSIGSLVKTKGLKTISGLLKQRKRWMSGAMCLSWPWKMILGLQVLWFPAILTLLVNYSGLAIAVWLLKILLQNLFTGSMMARVRRKIPLKELMLFECYYLITSLLTILYYWWPKPIEWKGREYL